MVGIMKCVLLLLCAGLQAAWAELPSPGEHVRRVEWEGKQRSYLLHVPAGLSAGKPVPVVLVLHGAGMNGKLMVSFSGMNAEAERSGFVAVYPNGTGALGTFLTWNSGGVPGSNGSGKPDDVGFLRLVLDDLESQLPVDRRRVHAAGLSNGGMMVYKLAAEMSDRIASVAAVAGTMTTAGPAPLRPVPVLHVHGTADRIVPYRGSGRAGPRAVGFRSVEETVRTWAQLNGCAADAVREELADVHPEDGTRVTRHVWGPGQAGAEVVLLQVSGGGHTWPGQLPTVTFIGKSTRDIDGNAVIWEFFRRHPLPEGFRAVTGGAQR
jgi:polyhydroxybutyrate depolymerase